VGLNFKRKSSTLVKKSQLIYPAIVLGSVFAACTPEPARRSAVESSTRCSSDPDKSVWAGTCLATQASTTGVSGDSNGGRSPEAVSAAAVPAAAAPAAAAPAGAAPAAAAPPAAAPVVAESDPAAQQAAGIKIATDAVEGITPAVVDVLGQVLNGGGAKPGTPAKTETEGASTYVVTFSRDSFVGIADNSVIKNCFVSSGAVLEVKGEPKKITEFSSLGVSQYVTGETLDASLTGGSDSCELKGKDFVFISGHASFAAKP
jgi:hypothetical protein